MPRVLARAIFASALTFLVAHNASLSAQEAPAGATLEAGANDDASTQAVKAHFKAALVHIEFRRYKEAAAELEKALAAKPNSELVIDLYKQTVAKFMDAAITSKDPKLREMAEKLQTVALKGRILQFRDPAYVEKLVGQVEKGDFLERTLAMQELISAGDYAVPAVVHMIATTPDPERRAYGGYILSQLRGTAVPAICESLKIPTPIVRQVIIQALEVIKDARSVPWLLWLGQDAAGNPLVAAAARQALAKVAKDPADTAAFAPQAFLKLSEDYYAKDRRVLLPHLYEHLVWRYNPRTKKLTSESVPRYLYPYRMAEELARTALLIDPAYEPAVPALINALFAQQNDLESFFKAIEGQEMTPELQNEADLAKPIRERLKVAPLVAHAAGKKLLFAALSSALRTDRTDVAHSCILALRDVCDGAAIPRPLTPEEIKRLKREKKKASKPAGKKGSLITWFGAKQEDPSDAPAAPNPHAVQIDGLPLIQALSYPADRRVRYAAAEALVAIAPKHLIRDGGKVMENLADALSETAYRISLVIDEDEAAAEELRPILQDIGLVPILARTQRNALQRAQEVPPKDLLIVSATLEKIDVVEMIKSLRSIDKLAATPTLVVTSRTDQPALAQKLAGLKVGYIIRPFVASSVRAAVSAVLKTTVDPKGEEAAVRYASTAAASLATIDPATSIFKLTPVLPAMLRAVVSRTQPDSVRIPISIAIATTGDPKALPYLVEAFNDPKSSKPLRIALLHALGACSAGAVTLPTDVAHVINRASYDGDYDFRAAAAKAFGLHGGVDGAFIPVVDQLHGIKP
ncbi:HEAT repeat domain-containing protein [bacterium]|nr:HEAT repeat domain-containing protein [bacterium]